MKSLSIQDFSKLNQEVKQLGFLEDLLLEVKEIQFKAYNLVGLANNEKLREASMFFQDDVEAIITTEIQNQIKKIEKTFGVKMKASFEDESK